MELLKSNTIVHDNYKPIPSGDFIQYFNRAMVFAQNNYWDQIVKANRTSFKHLVSTSFFEEYLWCLVGGHQDPKRVSVFFPEIQRNAGAYCKAFWDLNNFPSESVMLEKFESIPVNENEFRALHRTAYIINQGTRLFGWPDYKSKFLSSPSKLLALPGLTLLSANILAQNIGLGYSANSYQKLHDLACKFGFSTPDDLVSAIQKHFSMSPITIGMILWYSATTFEVS